MEWKINFFFNFIENNLWNHALREWKMKSSLIIILKIFFKFKDDIMITSFFIPLTRDFISCFQWNWRKNLFFIAFFNIWIIFLAIITSLYFRPNSTVKIIAFLSLIKVQFSLYWKSTLFNAMLIVFWIYSNRWPKHFLFVYSRELHELIQPLKDFCLFSQK